MFEIVWGTVLIVFTFVLCWLAQVVNALFPDYAIRMGLNEDESDVDPTFFADTRGEAIWDAITLWPLPLAGILLLMNNPHWAYFGLIGGGVYLYFAGRGILVRWVMQRRGIQIGKPASLKLYFNFLVIWGLIGLTTIILALNALTTNG